MTEDELRRVISKISINNGLGDLDSGYSDYLRGLGASSAPTNRDNIGMFFFTRPLLNLSYDNLAAHRILTPLLTQSADISLQRYIRTVLDPINEMREGITTPLLSPGMPFINLFTNCATNISGWPDINVDTYDSKPGIRKEQWSMVDGVYKIHNTFSLTVDFISTLGDPVLALIATWIYCATEYRFGDLIPHNEHLMQRVLNYQTGIYHLVLDPSKKYIQHIAKTIGYPITVPFGAKFNYNHLNADIENNASTSIQFKCVGAEYNDPILFDEFNRCVALKYFSPGLRITRIYDNGKLDVAGDYINIPSSLRRTSRYRAIPLIHPLSQELTWWVSSTIYSEMEKESVI